MTIDRTRRAAWVGVALLACSALTACARLAPHESDGNGQTHWLSCERDRDCPSDQLCESGFCMPAPGRADAGPSDAMEMDVAMESIGTGSAGRSVAPSPSSDAGAAVGEPRPSSRSTDGRDFACGEADPAWDDAVFEDVIYMWETYQPTDGYEAQLAHYVGDPLTGFRLVYECSPPETGRFAIEDPESGVQTDPFAPLVAHAGVYLAERDQVFDLVNGRPRFDRFIGQVPNAMLFWTPVDLDTTAGVRGFDWDAPIGLTAGYHLFVDGEEVPLDSKLEMDTEIND